MKTIQANAHILADGGANASGVTANLEIYVLSSRRWSKIATGKSNAKGIWRATATKLQTGAFYAPGLRLTEAGAPAPRVLALGGFMRYDQNKQVLTVDFGRIERLQKTAYPLTASIAIFKSTKFTIAGQAKNTTATFTGVMRAPTPAVAASVLSAAELTDSNRNPVLESFDAEILKFKAKEAGLQFTISQKNELLATREVQLGTVKSQVAQLEKKLAQSLEIEKALKTQNKNFVEESNRKMPIQRITSNIGNEIDAANTKLRNEKRPYRFGRIELDLRGSVSTDGQSMTLASLVDLKDLAGAVSLPSLKFEILPDNVTAEEISDVEVPDVIGLTETAVRRLLQAVGLRLEMVHRSIEPTKTLPIGQSIQQSPMAGEKLPRSETVLVVFATAKTNAEEVT
ncbi:MAG: PASTA domain-containing protein [Gammaproteobacteria bacterium]